MECQISSLKVVACLQQCFFFSANTAQVTPKIVYFYYLKIYLQDQSIHACVLHIAVMNRTI